MLTKRNYAKRSRGQAIVEGVVALWMIVMLTVGAVVLLVNCGLAMCGQQKVTMVCNILSFYAASSPSTLSDAQVQANVQAMAKTLCGTVQLTYVDASAKSYNCSLPTGATVPGYTIQVSANAPLLFGAGSIPLKDTCSLPITLTQFNNYNSFVQINDASTSGNVYLVPAFSVSMANYGTTIPLPATTNASVTQELLQVAPPLGSDPCVVNSLATFSAGTINDTGN